MASVLDSLQRINNPNSLRFTNRTLKKRKITKESKDLPYEEKKNNPKEQLVEEE